jgi:hypothetical protein
MPFPLLLYLVGLIVVDASSVKVSVAKLALVLPIIWIIEEAMPMGEVVIDRSIINGSVRIFDLKIPEGNSFNPGALHCPPI